MSKMPNESSVCKTAIYDNFSNKFVDVLIHRLEANTFVAKYSLPLINEREASHLNFWLTEAWNCAVADGLVADNERQKYRLELKGNLTVNEAIDRAQELNGMNVCVRGLLFLDFEHIALRHSPKSEYREWISPSNAVGHHRLNGSEIWVDLSKLGLTRVELVPAISGWVSIFGTLHAVIPPNMNNNWHSRLGNWLKYGTKEPVVGLGHWGAYSATIDVLEIIDLQPITAKECEQADTTKNKVIRGSNVTSRIIRSRQSEVQM